MLFKVQHNPMLMLTVHIPSEEGNATENTLLTVTSHGDPAVNDQAIFHTTSKLYGVSLSPGVFSKSGVPGNIVTYNLQVTNTSEYSDTFTVKVSNESGWLVSADPMWIGPVESHSTAMLAIIVNIPIDAEKDSSSLTSVEVKSWSDHSKEASAYLTTYVAQYTVYLPLIQK